MKNMKRSLRRHHRARLIRCEMEKSKRLYFAFPIEDVVLLAKKRYNNPKMVQCPCCCNPRKYWKQKTLQEVKADMINNEYRREYGL